MAKEDHSESAPGSFFEACESCPWSRSIREILIKARPRRLLGSDIFVGSDFGGDHKESPFKVYGFLVIDVNLSLPWRGAIWEIRQLYIPDGRRMAFKRLSDAIRWRALEPFLTAAAENLSGHLVIILVWKNHKILTTGDPAEFLSRFRENGLIEVDWNLYDLERMVRICQFFTITVGSLTNQNADITWITDEDQITVNAKRLRDTHRMAVSLYSDYVFSQTTNTHQKKIKFCFNSTAKNRWFEDLISIPDLSIGAISEIFMKWSESGRRLENLNDHVKIADNVSPKTQVISRWLSSKGGTLKRRIVLVKPDGAYDFSILRL